MRFFLFFLISGWLSLSQVRAAETTIIAVLGDSLTAGYGIALQDAFPAQLESKLMKEGYNVKVLNHGVSGDTTAGGLARVEYVLKQNPHIVIIELGGNDLLRGVPPADIKKNLDAMMLRFQQTGIGMILAGQKAPFTIGAQYAEAYNALFSELAAKYKAVFYPFFLEGVYDQPGLMQSDGVHPNKEGVTALVEAIYPTVQKVIKK